MPLLASLQAMALLTSSIFKFLFHNSPYLIIIEKKKRKYGKCNTIIIGNFAGKENVFLIQNAFPIIAEFFDHIHTVEGKPITVHNELNRILTENLGEVLALYNRGIHLIFSIMTLYFCTCELIGIIQ